MKREDIVLSALIIEDWCKKHRNRGGGPCDCPLQVANMYMSNDAKYTCDFCKSKTGGDDGFIYCPYCGEPYDTKGYVTDRPLPCVRDEHGEIREQTVKQLLAKINEELDELKAVVFYSCDVYDPNCLPESCDNMIHTRIAEEAADVKTAITTLEEALGIDAEMRDEAQRRVNSKNRERGRL